MADSFQAATDKLKAHVEATAQAMISGGTPPQFVDALAEMDTLFNRDALNTEFLAQLAAGGTAAELQKSQLRLDTAAALDRETRLRYARPRRSIVVAAAKLRSHGAAGGTIDIRMIRGCS